MPAAPWCGTRGRPHPFAQQPRGVAPHASGTARRAVRCSRVLSSPAAWHRTRVARHGARCGAAVCSAAPRRGTAREWHGAARGAVQPRDGAVCRPGPATLGGNAVLSASSDKPANSAGQDPRSWTIQTGWRLQPPAAKDHGGLPETAQHSCRPAGCQRVRAPAASPDAAHPPQRQGSCRKIRLHGRLGPHLRPQSSRETDHRSRTDRRPRRRAEKRVRAAAHRMVSNRPLSTQLPTRLRYARAPSRAPRGCATQRRYARVAPRRSAARRGVVLVDNSLRDTTPAGNVLPLALRPGPDGLVLLAIGGRAASRRTSATNDHTATTGLACARDIRSKRLTHRRGITFRQIDLIRSPVETELHGLIGFATV
jgi:hypothetical protein